MIFNSEIPMSCDPLLFGHDDSLGLLGQQSWAWVRAAVLS